jgi:NAD(P)-dependent dehydrogenase (short-subunit alcohol dehydrogenase family)
MSSARTALVTGGCSGIGLAICTELAKTGMRIAILDRSVRDGEELADALRTSGAPEVLIQQGDLAALDQHDRLIDTFEQELGPIDVLVNNAGIPAKVRGDLLSMSSDSFDDAFAVNVRGTFFLTQNVARRMLDRETDKDMVRAIVVISSVSTTMASPERGEYCMSKASLPMLVNLFAVRLAAHGIGVFEVRPGIIRTPMTAGVASRYDGLIDDGLVPARRWGEADDVARIVRALAGGDFAFATGSVIQADGGLAIHRL